MYENKKTIVEADSSEFTRGVEAGLSPDDTKYWQAGYELGPGLNNKDTKAPIREIVQEESETPLFLKDTLDAHNFDAQDEKDKSAE